MRRRSAKRRSIVKELRHGRQTKGRHKKKTIVLSKNKSDQGSEEILRTQPVVVDGSEHLVPEPKLQRSQFSFDGYGAGNIGALEVVNRRIRARNLQRKLRQIGGLTAWLALQGLDRFAAVLERRKRCEYQLADLTMRNLKDLGMNAVGARRKLIHAIDLLCQPYFSRAANDV
ncbi:hypothetical protein HPP92_023288 [Vanilla planifolia]|uniref:SAM domain-containing protein n=1 Tax=Vanilla planifolia TaxID=51239 RepID=A0A835PTJ0_VANPL|nr:hypothetical protein HPP92_023288 [Vanilla planifolia]